MENLLPVVCIGLVIAALALNYFSVRRQERKNEIGLMSVPPMQAPQPDINEIAVKDWQIVEFMQRGQKINAIKRYRDLTNAGLKEAKDAIEFAYEQSQPPQNTFSTPTTEPMPVNREVLRDPELVAAMQRGNKIAAIKRYRELTNAGLKDAKDAIEQHFGR